MTYTQIQPRAINGIDIYFNLAVPAKPYRGMPSSADQYWTGFSVFGYAPSQLSTTKNKGCC